MDEGELYSEIDVSWAVDDIDMEGTISYPIKKGHHVGVFFIAGSGPTDRNWCSPLLPGTNGSGKLLAEALAMNGYATIRYDKRPSGPHLMESASKLVGKISMKSHIEEVAGALETFKSSGLVDKNRIFALTNSEGAIHALNYQLEKKGTLFKGLVLTGAPGRAVGDVAREQILAQVGALENRDKIMESYDEAIADFLSGKEVKVDASLPDSIRLIIGGLVNPANLPFSRELWILEPAELVRKANVPTLIIIGRKDLQINWKLDGERLEEATEGMDDVTVFYPENSDHVLKYEDKQRDQLVPEQVGLHYNDAERKLDSDVLSAILEWLNEHSR